MQEKIYYYRFKKLNFWLFFNFLLTGLAAAILIRWPCCILWSKMQFFLGVIIVSYALWTLMYVKKHRLAVVNEDGIAIDHCARLCWTDIDGVWEKDVRCLFRKRRILVLHPKESFKCDYNPVQKLCIRSGFTAFSLPLYAMSEADQAEIKDILTARGIRVADKEPS